MSIMVSEEPIEEPVGAEEVAKMLGVTPRTVTRLADSGKIPGFRVGKLWKFRPSDIKQHIEGQIRQHTDKSKDEK